MLRTFAHLALTLVLAIPIGASALEQTQPSISNVQPAQVTPPLLDSSSLTKQLSCETLVNTREQKDCFNKNYKQADQKLKQVYSRLISFFELDNKPRAKERKRKLSRAEEAWGKFRDANCDFRSSGWDNEKQAVFRQSCLTRVTQERTQELEEFLQRGG